MINRIFVSFVLLIFASAAGFAQNTGTLSGTVRLAGENTVLHEASVQIIELKRTTATDNNGAYRFAGVPAGTYTITVHQEGFADLSKKVTVTPGATATTDFALTITGLKEQVTVTASGSEVSTFEALESVSTVNSSQITERAAVGLGDVLNNEAGVSKRSSGPGTSRPVIRGFDGDRVLVSTDGVSVGSLASQSGDHSEPVDTLAVERIEVVKGPATLLYGSNAIGGVVNAISGHDEGAHPGIRGYFSTLAAVSNTALRIGCFGEMPAASGPAITRRAVMSEGSRTLSHETRPAAADLVISPKKLFSARTTATIRTATAYRSIFAKLIPNCVASACIGTI